MPDRPVVHLHRVGAYSPLADTTYVSGLGIMERYDDNELWNAEFRALLSEASA